MASPLVGEKDTLSVESNAFFATASTHFCARSETNFWPISAIKSRSSRSKPFEALQGIGALEKMALGRGIRDAEEVGSVREFESEFNAKHIEKPRF